MIITKNDETGRSAYNPKILCKGSFVRLFTGIINLSQNRARLLGECDVYGTFRVTSRPDHSTIAAFVTSMKDQILPLFCDILLVCEQENLLGGTSFALDGLKLAGNASMQWSGKLSEISKKKHKIEHKVKQLLQEQIIADQDDNTDLADGSNRAKAN